MTLEEAIEKLKFMHNDNDLEGEQNALKLGIEALKMWKEVRKEGRWPASTRLPGETYIPENVGILPSDET